MKRRLIIRPDAQRDIEQIYQYYGDIRDHTGQSIVDALKHAFELIEEHPEAFQVVYR